MIAIRIVLVEAGSSTTPRSLALTLEYLGIFVIRVVPLVLTMTVRSAMYRVRRKTDYMNRAPKDFGTVTVDQLILALSRCPRAAFVVFEVGEEVRGIQEGAKHGIPSTTKNTHAFPVGSVVVKVREDR